MRPDGTTRKKWRIPDGKDGEWIIFMFEASKVVAIACVDWRPHWLGREEQALIMYWRIWDLWGPTNLVALTVVKLDDTLLYLQDV
jgi:hypothetical protein